LEGLVNQFVEEQTASNKACPAKLLQAKNQLNTLHQVILQLASKINTTTAAIQSLQESVQNGMQEVSDADELRKQGLAKCQKVTMVQAKLPDPSEVTSINFQKSKLIHSNLAGKGPDKGGAKEMLFQNVGVVDGQSIDLVITTTTVYIANNVLNNKQVANLGGSINGKAPTPLGFKFLFVRSGSRTPVAPKHYYFSFLDIDKHPKAIEQIELRGFDQYYVTPTTELRISTAVDGMTKFQATGRAQEGDNPTDVDNLSQLQANRVTLLFSGRSEFEVVFRLTNSRVGAGNLFFTGSTSLVTKSQGEAYSVGGPKDQACDEAVESKFNRDTLLDREQMSGEVKELMKRTDELPRLRPQIHAASDAWATLQKHVEVLSKACKSLPATLSDLSVVRKAIDALKSCPGLDLPNLQIPSSASEETR